MHPRPVTVVNAAVSATSGSGRFYRARRSGFSSLRPPIDSEVAGEIDRDAAVERLEDELGDLLFAVTNLARHLKIDPDSALRRTNAKFEARFQAIEVALAKEGRSIEDADLEEMERLWQAAKKQMISE